MIDPELIEEMKALEEAWAERDRLWQQAKTAWACVGMAAAMLLLSMFTSA